MWRLGDTAIYVALVCERSWRRYSRKVMALRRIALEEREKELLAGPKAGNEQ